MPRCPVCQTRYPGGNKTERCPLCGWDVQALSLITGLIPEVAQKEAVRLEWAKQLWSRAKLHQDESKQYQIQLGAEIDRSQQLQAQMEQVNQEKAALSEILRQREEEIAHLQGQLNLAHSEATQPVISEPVLFPEEDLDIDTTEEIGLEELRLPQRETAKQPQEPEWLETDAPEIQNLESLPEEQPFIADPVPQKAELPWAEPEPSALIETFELEALESEESWLHDRAELIPQTPALQEITLQEFSFEVVNITPEGWQLQQHQASFFNQPLGDGIDLEMVLLPGGSFCMGSPEIEAGRDKNEGPQHQVTVSPFCMSKFPITQAQWQVIAALPKINRSLSLYPSDFEGNDRPVEQVSWYDTIEFCARLSQKTGQHYRLPSEAEWEYACRAGTTTPFHFGDTITSEAANYDGTYTYGFDAQGVYRQGTTPIWVFSIANAFGLFDMHGNVWEWCADAWHETYQDAPVDGSVWESDEGAATYRVLRGGAWYCLPELCRSAQRHWNQPDMAGSGIGFRVVCSVS